jgi:hypothetical protein
MKSSTILFLLRVISTRMLVAPPRVLMAVWMLVCFTLVVRALGPSKDTDTIVGRARSRCAGCRSSTLY